MRNLEMPREREKKSPEDLRRVLGQIYPEEMVDYLMVRLGFDDDRDSGLVEEG